MIDKLQMLLGRCKCGVYIDVNGHRDVYEAVKERLEWYGGLECPPDIDEETRAKILRTDTIVDLHFYPDTPIGSYHIVSYSLDAALDRAMKCLW